MSTTSPSSDHTHVHSHNVVVLRGTVSSEPHAREMPSGAVIVNLEVTTRVADAGVSVPVVVESAGVDCAAGDDVVVTGHVRRRFFRAGGVTQSRTEVVASAVVRASRRKAAERAVALAVAGLADPIS